MSTLAGLRLTPSALLAYRRCLLKPQVRRFAFLPFAQQSPALIRRPFSFTSNAPTITAVTEAKVPESPLGGLADGFARGKQALKDAAGERSKPFFPDTSSKPVGYWLIGSAGLVFGIVVLGGLTRLTESGYHISCGQLISELCYQLLTTYGVQTLNHRMEARNRHPPATDRRGLGRKFLEIPQLARIPHPEPKHGSRWL